MKISNIKPEALGKLIINTVLAAHMAHHSRPAYTVKDYKNLESSLEAEFLHDYLTMQTDSIVEKWYDGPESASKLISTR